MIGTAVYEVELRLNGKLIGNIRELAQNLTWSKKRTRIGVDSISFTLNDQLFAKWCAMRGVTVADMLCPLALDCRVVRNGVPVVGGYLATMPAYQANGTSASLSLSFDGYINYLANVYLDPYDSYNGKMGDVIKRWITIADDRATGYGKAFGFKVGNIADMAVIQESFDGWKAIKDAITDRCDNTTGAGMFEVYFHPDRTYDVIKESDFGEEITDYVVQYPAQLNGVSALELNAGEISGFASRVDAIGSEQAEWAYSVNRDAVKKYGYAEKMLQESSITAFETLRDTAQTEVSNTSNLEWQPQIKLTGKQVAPIPTGERKIWIGDTIKLQNNIDPIGMMSGEFRVNSLDVSVEATGAETITPTLSRSEAINTSSFIKDFARMRNNLLAVGSSRTSGNMVE